VWVEATVTIHPELRITYTSIKATESEFRKHTEKYYLAVRWLRLATIKLEEPWVIDLEGYEKPKEPIKFVHIRANIKTYGSRAIANISIRADGKYSALLSIMFNLADINDYVVHIMNGSHWNFAVVMAGILALKYVLREQFLTILAVLGMFKEPKHVQ